MKQTQIPFSRRLLMHTMLVAGIVGLSANSRAEDLGEIQVESSTISDRQGNKSQEPSSVTTISGDQVDAAHTENIQQLLQSIPGVTTEIQSGDSLKIHIRGMDNQQFMGENPGVVIVIDGVPVFERTGRVNVDLDNIESITVIRGSASYLFGNDALGGAIIITTKRGAYRQGQRYVLESGSFGYYKALGSYGENSDKYNYYLQVSSRGAIGYYDDSSYSADYLNGKYQYYLSDTSDITIGMELGHRTKNSHGTVTGVSAALTDPRSTDPAYDDYANHYDVNLNKLFITYNNDLSASRTMTVSMYQFGDHTTFFSAPNTNPGEYKYDNDYQQVQRGLKAELRDKGEKRAWMMGLDLRANSYTDYVTVSTDFTSFPGPVSWTAGDLYSHDKTEENVAAIYGEYKYRVSQKWTLVANSRLDAVTLDNLDIMNSTSDSRNYLIDSWRIGATRKLGGNRHLFANISTGFRLPSVQETFTGRYSSAGSIAANPDLVPETALNIELGMRGNLRGGDRPIEFEVALFNIRRMDYILSTAGLYSGGAGSSFENIGDAVNNGVELGVKGKHSEKLSWNLAYTWLDARFTRYDNFNLLISDGAGGWNTTSYDLAGNVIPRVPQHHLNINMAYKFSDRLVFNGEVDGTSMYYADELNTLPVAGRSVVNVMLSYKRERSEQNYTTWFLRIDNLLDTDYYNTARAFYDSNEDQVFDAEDMSITVNQGRTFTVGLVMKF
jgi:iron complex outermembrane receptor protein